MKRIFVRCIPLCAVLFSGCEDRQASSEEARRNDRPADLFAPYGELHQLSQQPILVIGLDEALPLFRVKGAVFFGDGIAIANMGSSEVLIVDSGGRLVGRQGREGAGPGDYGKLLGLVRYNDGLIAWDGMYSRVTILDSSGRYVSDTKIPGRLGKSIVGAFGSSVLVQLVTNGYPGDGDIGPLENRFDVVYEIVRLSDGVVTFETTRPGEEKWVQRRGNGHGGLPVIFGRTAVSAVTGRRAYVATTDSLTLTEYDETGNSLEVPFEHHRAIPEKGWEQFVRDSLLAHIEAKALGRRGPIIEDGKTLLELFSEFDLSLVENLPTRLTLPSFSDIKGGSDGHLWIREYPKPMQRQVVWIALSETWERKLRVEMPMSFQVLDLSEHRVLVLGKGEYGEDLVEVYLIER